MPRKYVSKAVRKSTHHDPDKIKKAIEAINNGLGLRECAKKFNMSSTTLHRHLKSGGTLKKKGGQTALTPEEEAVLVDRLQVCSDWGYPIDSLTLRLLVKDFLDRQGKKVSKFKNNTPGPDFVVSFLTRYKHFLSNRMCQNIKRSRAQISPEVINSYFDELTNELAGVPAANIINYDETNLCDDPGRKKLIFRRGCKYPERIINSSKASTSVMFAATGEGKILPPYVVYKAQHLYDSWREGGPKHSRYNRTKSGWFDNFCFQDWVETIAIPHFRNVDGPKIMIGDNLSSHLSLDVIRVCKENNIKFVFLPSNSTHLTQPLDVAFFRPMKIAWRQILEEWKLGPGKHEASVPKDKFPPLLKKLMDTLNEDNVKAGFKKCGLVPLNRKPVLQMLPDYKSSLAGINSNNDTASQNSIQDESVASSTSVMAIDDSFKELLRSLRQYDSPQPKKRRTKVNVAPGKSLQVSDFGEDPDDPEPMSSNMAVKKAKPKKVLKEKVNTKDSTTEESDYSIQDSDKDFRLDSSSEEEPTFDTTGSIPDTPASTENFSPDDFCVVKVYGKVESVFRLYVCQLEYPQDDGFVGKFYKKVTGTKRFVQTDEDAFFQEKDILKKLHPVTGLQTSSRFKNMVTFHDDLDNLILY